MNQRCQACPQSMGISIAASREIDSLELILVSFGICIATWLFLAVVSSCDKLIGELALVVVTCLYASGCIAAATYALGAFSIELNTLFFIQLFILVVMLGLVYIMIKFALKVGAIFLLIQMHSWSANPPAWS